MKIARLLLRLYPRCWRDRYGDEFMAMLEAQRLSFTDVLDVALNALDAHINPNLSFADTSLNERVRLLMQKLRSAEIMIFAAWIAFVVAGLHFNGLMDDSPYSPLMGNIGLDLDLHQPLGVTWTVLSAGSMIALLAVLAGGLPLAYAAWQRSPQVRRFFIVPVVAFITVILPPSIRIGLRLAGVIPSHSPTPLGMDIALTVWLIVAAIASTWAVTRAISRADIDVRLMHFAYLPGIVTTLAMALMLGATIAWGVFAHIQEPHLFDSANYFVGYPTAISWGLIVLTMTVSTIIAAMGCIRGMSARGNAEDGALATA